MPSENINYTKINYHLFRLYHPLCKILAIFRLYINTKIDYFQLNLRAINSNSTNDKLFYWYHPPLFLDWRVFVVFFDCKCDSIMKARKWSNCFSLFSAFYVLVRKTDTWGCQTWSSNFSKLFGLVSKNFSIFLPHHFY